MKNEAQQQSIENVAGASEQGAPWYRLALARLGPFLGLIVLTVFLAIASPVFLSPGNLVNIARQSSINAILAAGQTFVVLTSGIDLSVGSILGFGSCVAASAAVHGVAFPIAVACGLLAGGLMGLINGTLVSRTRIPPFIVTLGMLNIARGATYLWTGGYVVSNLPSEFSALGGSVLLGIPTPVLIMIVVYIAGFFVLNLTKFGRSLYAIGGNLEAAKLSGIDVKKSLMLVYVIAGVLAALGGVVLAGRVNSGQPEAGVGYELDAVAAVVIGGTSLFGGQGDIRGTLLGAFVMGILRNGLNLLNVSAFWQQIAIGVVVIGAVGVDTLRKRD